MTLLNVILVFWCTELASGFIIPERHSDSFLDQDNVRPADDETKPRHKEIENYSKVKQSLQNTVNINENELYKDVTPKTNNVNERSLVYLNQKYRNNNYKYLHESRKLKEKEYSAFMTNSDYSNRDFSDIFDTLQIGQVTIDNDFLIRQNFVNTKINDVVDSSAMVELVRSPISRRNQNLKTGDERITASPIYFNANTASNKNNSKTIISATKLFNSPNKEGYSSCCQEHESKYIKAGNKGQVLGIVPKVIKENFLPASMLPKNRFQQDLYNKKIAENHIKSSYPKENVPIHYKSEDCSHHRDTFSNKKNLPYRFLYAKVQHCKCDINTKGKQNDNRSNIKTSSEDYETFINQGLSNILPSNELTEGEEILKYLPDDELQNV